MQISSASCCLVTKLFLTLWLHGLQHARLLSLSSTISQSLLKYNFIEYIFICFNGGFFGGCVCEIFMVFFIQDYVICEQRKFFLIWMPFISFSCLITFVICSVLCLISESGHPYLVTDLRGKAFHFFHCWVWC